MLAGIRSRLTYANVMATIAVFIALGLGTAWAIEKNSVQSKHIASGAVSLPDTNTELRLKCPDGTAFVEGACLERQDRELDIWSDAMADCADEGRRLPSPAELLSARREPRITVGDGVEWTHAIAQTEPFRVTIVADDQFTYSVGAIDAWYRCVAPPKG